ncbi:hypothetical protein [Trinickia soli]|uniref:MarR family transcriptional regulator n=1 Tax=Trinickia soli TaxID=380675 RepID=A0A2N7VQ49_9BURK|nr:hypothetical protein [Trinickia soli]PMS19291.1 hypothetical protein C0Z19_21925 [Trinickia soli]CAB3644438.1 hypothetical protein LMG24076_00491 [Trinickia soli]
MTPFKFPHATPEQVLERMKPDRLYTSPELAEKFEVPKQYMQDVLYRLGRTGDIERVRQEDRTLAWAKVIKRTPKDLTTSVAGPAYPPDLKATMHGYDAMFQTRVELAMMARGR